MPSTTLDAHAQLTGLSHVHWLSVDAEGWDALIIEGAARLLRERRVDVLEFEYHAKGMWAAASRDRRNLKDVLASLSASGYTCFWQGDRGALAQASGARWCDDFEWRGHSNLVCSHLGPLISALHRLEVGQLTAAPEGRPRRRDGTGSKRHANAVP